MNKRSFLLILAVMVSAVFVFAAACSPAAEDDPTVAPVATSAGGDTESSSGGSDSGMMDHSVSGVPIDANARMGGVLTIATTSEGPTFSNWEEAAGSAPHYNHPIANMLVSRQDWGDQQSFLNGDYWNIVPDLASAWEQAEDGRSWTFTLRDGIEFSDGVPFTCADVAWSYNTIRTGAGLNRSPRAVHFSAVSDITCADDLTTVFSLSKAKPSLLEAIAAPYHVIKPKHLYENDTDAMRDAPNIGTGPYVMARWDPGERMVFERKTDYWDQPFPYLDGLEVLILPNPAQVTALRAGRLHIGGSAAGWNGQRANTLLRECNVCQKWGSAAHPGMMFSVVPNFAREPWNTQEMRDAISLAIDRQKMIDLGYNGWIELGTGGPFLASSYFAMPEERIQQIPGHDFRDPEANKERARQIIADEGFSSDDLTVSIVHAPFYAPYIVTVLEDLNAVGIVASAQQQETALYYTSMSNGDFDLAGHAGWIGGFDPDFILYEYFYSGSDRNYGRYSNVELDKIIDEQSITLDREQRRELAWQAGEIVLRDQVRSLGGFQLAVPIFSDKVAGIMPTVPSQSYGNFYRHAHTYLLE